MKYCPCPWEYYKNLGEVRIRISAEEAAVENTFLAYIFYFAFIMKSLRHPIKGIMNTITYAKFVFYKVADTEY